eukprot:NODE_1_length_95616_cov_0.657642.p63 type:complete len:170 gc:universal NODE_1_length_95616_cov_0.657642:67195-67704(+)
MVQLFVITASSHAVKEHWEACGLSTATESLGIRTYLFENQKIYYISLSNYEFIYQLPLHSLIQINNVKLLDVLLNKWNRKRDQLYQGYSTSCCNIDFKVFQINNLTLLEISGEFKKCPPVLLEKIVPFHLQQTSEVLIKTHLFKNCTIEPNTRDGMLLWLQAIFEHEIQ